MKYCLSLAALFTVLAAGQGQETPETQLDFIRKLRAKGYADLALEKLEEFAKTAPAALKPFLPLEVARTRMVMARDKSPEEKLTLAAEAAKELADFVAKNPGKREAAVGRLEIARLSNFQGQAWLNKSLRAEDPKVVEADAKKAEELFLKALAELAAAEKEIGDEEKTQVRLERGIALIDQARCNFQLQEFKKGGEILQEAKQLLEEVVKADNTSSIGILAGAWLIRVYTEAQAPDNAERMFKQLQGLKTPEARAGLRWARLFNMQRIPKDPRITPPAKNVDGNLYKLNLVIKEGESWLAEYKANHNSPEGYAVRYELAESYYQEGVHRLRDIKDPKNPKGEREKDLKTKANQAFAKAQPHYAFLAEKDCEFAEKAFQKNLELAYFNVTEKKSLLEFKTFDETFLKARIDLGEYQRINEELAKEKDETKIKELNKKSKEVLRATVKAIQRALSLADARTSVVRLSEARYTLMQIYFTIGDMYRAAVVGEALARDPQARKRSAIAAASALEAYKILANQETAEGDRRVHRERLLALAAFVTENKDFRNDPVNGMARFSLAEVFDREEKFDLAIKQLAALPETYSEYSLATSQIVLIALKAKDRAAKERTLTEDPAKKAEKEKEMKMFEDIARKTAKNLKLPPKANGHTAYSYFIAQTHHVSFIYQDAYEHYVKGESEKAIAKFQEMSEFNAALRKEFDALPADKLTPEAHERLRNSMIGVDKLSRLSRSDLAYRAGQFDKVLEAELTGQVVADVEALGAKADGPIRLKDFDMTGKLLNLAFRAQVQKGNVAKARGILKLLERLSGEEGAIKTGNTADVLQKLIFELQIQVRDLKKRGEQAKGDADRNAAKQELERTVNNFSAFLDDYEKSTKGLKPKEILFLANCYEGMNKPDKAVHFFEQYPKTEWMDKPFPKEGKQLRAELAQAIKDSKDAMDAKDDDKAKAAEARKKEVEQEIAALEKIEQEIGIYCQARLKLAQQLRQVNKYDEAEKVLTGLKGHKNLRGLIFIEYENNLVQEDKKLWGKAINQWAGFMRNPSLQRAMTQDKKFKDMYFQAYMRHAYCWYQYSQTPKVKEGGMDKKFLDYAVDYILKLEFANTPDGWNAVERMAKEILASEAVLNARYLELRPKFEEKKKQAGPKGG